MKSFLAVILALGFFYTSPAVADSNSGTKSYQFLKIGPVARAAALGNAFTAVKDDPGALFYNPAGVATLKQRGIILSYMNYVSDIQSGAVGYLHPILGHSLIGGSITYLTYGDFVQSDESGNQTGNFGVKDFSFNLTYGWSAFPFLNLGATSKIIHEKIDDLSGYGWGLDLGAIYSLPDSRTNFGFAVQNLGAEINAIGGEKAGLPTQFKLGLTHILKGSEFLFLAEINKPVDYKFFFNFGVEISKIQPLLLRAGWSTSGSDLKFGGDSDQWAGISFGLGALWQELKIDYSHSFLGALGGVHRVTLSKNWE